MPRGKQQPKEKPPEERIILMKVTGNNCKIESDVFTDFEILGILRAATLTYENRFQVNGGGESDKD